MGTAAPGPAGAPTHRLAADDGYTVHEVNSTCEWRGLNAAVPDVDVPARIVDWLEARASAA